MVLQVSWNGGEVHVETSAVEPHSGAVGPVDEDWVKGLYDMQGRRCVLGCEGW